MENERDQLTELGDIKRIMERSSRFLSLSGLSGVAAGICGLAGAFFAQMAILHYATAAKQGGDLQLSAHALTGRLVWIAVFTLAAAVLLAIFFTARTARRSGLPLWDAASRRLVINLLIPLAAGGIFIVVMAGDGEYRYLAATSLLFYGLALINAGKYTLTDIRFLGLLETAAGIICLFFPGYGLYFWAFGFGALHLIYGVLMWNKYERNMGQNEGQE